MFARYERDGAITQADCKTKGTRAIFR